MPCKSCVRAMTINRYPLFIDGAFSINSFDLIWFQNDLFTFEKFYVKEPFQNKHYFPLFFKFLKFNIIKAYAHKFYKYRLGLKLTRRQRMKSDFILNLKCVSYNSTHK